MGRKERIEMLKAFSLKKGDKVRIDNWDKDEHIEVIEVMDCSFIAIDKHKRSSTYGPFGNWKKI